jgi:integration host factor subunit alpha
MSITKKDIADLLVEQIGITHNQALSMTNNFFDTIKGNVEQDQELLDKAMPILKGFMSAISD